MIGLLNRQPLPNNLHDLIATGQVEMRMEPNTEQPFWAIKVQAHALLAVGSWYAIGWTTKGPITAALAAGNPWMVGQAIEATASGAWGWLIVAGYLYQIASSGAVPDGSDVEVLTTDVTAVIDAGVDSPLLSVNGLGHAQCAASGNLVDVWLYGIVRPTVAST